MHVHRSRPAGLDGVVKGDGVLALSGHSELGSSKGFDGCAVSEDDSVQLRASRTSQTVPFYARDLDESAKGIARQTQAEM